MEKFWSDFVQNLLMAFAPLLATLIAAVLFAWFKKTWAEFRMKQPDLAWALEEAATLAVRAAEQAGAAELIDNKKDYALDVAERFLAAKGLDIDLNLIDDAIEAAVYAEINKGKEKSPTASSAPTLPTWFTSSSVGGGVAITPGGDDDDPVGALTDSEG